MARSVWFRVGGAVVAGVTLAGMGVGVSSGLVAKSSPPQPTPTVVVSPHTKLVDLQDVTVVGTGFSANADIGTVECQSGALDVNSCDLSTLVYTTADGSGAFSLKRPVRRLILVSGGTVDCGAPAGCILGAGNVSNFAEASGAAISFDPTKPPVVAKLKVKPAKKLRDHQLVTVTGKGFFPGSFVDVVECSASDLTSCAYETDRYTAVSPMGRISFANYAIERQFQSFGFKGEPTTIDCAAAPHTCVLVANGGTFGGGVPAIAALSFDKKIPPAVPAITVAPSTGLADLQLVTVHGSGFLPGTTVTVLQCAANTFSCNFGQGVTAGFVGQFTLTLAVNRILSGQGPVGTTSTDCASQLGACTIVAFANGALTSPTVPLAFDPTKPPVVPTIGVQPNAHLQDNQRVDVNAGGFAPYRPVAFVECGEEALIEHSLSYCDFSTQIVATTPAGGGQPSAAFFVRRAINAGGGLVDCGLTPGACVLVAAPYTYYGGGGGGVGKSAKLGAALVPRAAVRRAAKGATPPGIPGAASAPLSFDKALPGT